jgi:hypothetical protein
MEVVMWLCFFSGIVIILMSISLVQWLSERKPYPVKPEPMRHINQLVE